jgi:hypothetical protein
LYFLVFPRPFFVLLVHSSFYTGHGIDHINVSVSRFSRPEALSGWRYIISL